MTQMLQTGQLQMPAKPKPAAPPAKKPDVGLTWVEEVCQKCGGAMYIKRAPCWMHKQGWATAIRCVRCGWQKGFQHRT